MKVAYIGPFSVGSSNAPSVRVVGVGEALAQAGHSVTFLPLIDQVENPALNSGLELDVSLARGRRAGSIRNGADTLWMGIRASSWLSAQGEDFDRVILYHPIGTLLAPYLWRQARGVRRQPPLILDVVEWYDYRHLRGGRFGPHAIEHALAMNLLATRARSVICISQFLSNHFKSKGCRTLVVPPLMDVPRLQTQAVRVDAPPIAIAYAGSPGAKDALGLSNLSHASWLLRREDPALAFRVDVAGMTREEGLRICRAFTDSPPEDFNVHFRGRVPLDQARALVAGADYSFVQRPHARYSQAGFPSKVVESLLLGTPVITNSTSDLSQYIEDGNNGLLLGGTSGTRDTDGTSLADVVQMMRRLLQPGFHLRWSRDTIAARARADFNPRRYTMALSEFVREAP